MKPSDLVCSTSNVMRLFQAQSILGMIGSTVPFDSKFDEFRHSVFDAMLAVVKCTEILCKLNDES